VRMQLGIQAVNFSRDGNDPPGGSFRSDAVQPSPAVPTA